MQSLVRFARARLHAWQWQMSMEARSEQLQDLHGGWLVFISGCHCVAGRGRFTVMCRRGFSWPRPPDGDAARVRLQLTPGRDNREVNLFHHSWINHSRVMSIIYSMVTIQICNIFINIIFFIIVHYFPYGIHSICEFQPLFDFFGFYMHPKRFKTASGSLNKIDSLATFDGGKDVFRPQVFSSLWWMETLRWY